MLNSHLKSRYAAYLRALNEGEARVRLPDHQHDPTVSAGKVHASALGRCPLLKANERHNVPKRIQPTEDQELNLLHLFQQSARDAEVVQEAVVWGKTGEVEVSIDSDELRLRGRIDLLVDYAGERHIVEIKRRD